MIRKEITEGKSKLVVDETSFSDIPEHAYVFYNPFMVFDRDISVEIVKKYFENKYDEDTQIKRSMNAFKLKKQ